MPKLPIVNDKKLVSALKKMGFLLCRQRGTSHLVMKRPDGRRTVIPIHPGRDIPRGTLKAILKDIEISIKEFVENLK